MEPDKGSSSLSATGADEEGVGRGGDVLNGIPPKLTKLNSCEMIIIMNRFEDPSVLKRAAASKVSALSTCS